MQKKVQPSDIKTEIQSLVKNSDLVIEAHVLSTKGFKTNSGIYTSATVRILKLFKGTINDSIIEVVSEFGQVDGEGVFPSDGGWFALGPEEEGLLFLNVNTTVNKLKENLPSYVPSHGKASLIRYSGNTAVGLEKGLFADIEAVTGQKRKVLGLNEFERPSKLSLEAKVANSDAIIEGVVISRQGFHADTINRKGKVTSYGSVVVKVSKIFKGDIADSLIELVYLDGGVDEVLVKSYGFSVTDNEDGIFFLTKNGTAKSHNKDLPSFIPEYGRNSFARYKWADPSDKSYVAVCFNTTYHNVKQDLFQNIESLTGQKMVVLRPNLFGQ
jgi:hypothetical protein